MTECNEVLKRTELTEDDIKAYEHGISAIEGDELIVRYDFLLEQAKRYEAREKEINLIIQEEIRNQWSGELEDLRSIKRLSNNVAARISNEQACRHERTLFREAGWYRGYRSKDPSGVDFLFYMLKPRRKRKNMNGTPGYSNTVTGVLLTRCLREQYIDSKRHRSRIGWGCLYMSIDVNDLKNCGRTGTSQWAKLGCDEKLKLVIDGSPIEVFEPRLISLYSGRSAEKVHRNFQSLEHLATASKGNRWGRGTPSKEYPVRILFDNAEETPIFTDEAYKVKRETDYDESIHLA